MKKITLFLMLSAILLLFSGCGGGESGSGGGIITLPQTCGSCMITSIIGGACGIGLCGACFSHPILRVLLIAAIAIFILFMIIGVVRRRSVRSNFAISPPPSAQMQHVNQAHQAPPKHQQLKKINSFN